MSWGTGIIIGVVIFVLVNAVMVVIAVNQKIELVSENYYEKELKYQEQINKSKNALALTEPFLIEAAENGITLLLPKEFAGAPVTGSCKLYRPSDKTMDKVLNLNFDSSGKMLIPSTSLTAGYWKVYVEWNASGVGYATEKGINL